MKKKIKLSDKINHRLKPPTIGTFIVFFTDGKHTIIEEVSDIRVMNAIRHSDFGGRVWEWIYPWIPEEYEIEFD